MNHGLRAALHADAPLADVAENRRSLPTDNKHRYPSGHAAPHLADGDRPRIERALLLPQRVQTRGRKDGTERARHFTLQNTTHMSPRQLDVNISERLHVLEGEPRRACA